MLFCGLEMIVLHRCPVAAATLCEQVPAGSRPECTPPGEGCGGPVLPDQPARPGHAWVFCPFCQASIGICGAEAAAGVALEAVRALQEH